jgi:hypothetical protein
MNYLLVYHILLFSKYFIFNLLNYLFTIFSIASLIKLIEITNKNGPIAVIGSNGDIKGIEVITAVRRKKQLK